MQGARDITDWVVVSTEAGGADAKWWLSQPGDELSQDQQSWWLFKPVKHGTLKLPGGVVTQEYRRNEDQAEWLACRFAHLLDLPAAEVDLARRGTSDGVISRNVRPPGWELHAGDVVMADFEEYVPCAGNPKMRDRPGHHLDNIRTLLESALGPPDTSCSARGAFETFVGYLLFDAWIANTDRHAENWAVLFNSDGFRLAKSFDHGSALASGLDPKAQERVQAKGVREYCRGGLARRFDYSRGTTLVDLAVRGVSMAGREGADWVSRLGDLRRDQWQSLIADLDGVSEARATFLDDMLTVNQRRLLDASHDA